MPMGQSLVGSGGGGAPLADSDSASFEYLVWVGLGWVGWRRCTTRRL